jgi:hypothetical protein
MRFVLHPWQLFLAIMAGWINEHQQDVIEYLHTENQVLKERLGKKRILLNDDQRHRLAVKGEILGRKALSEIVSIATPDTTAPASRIDRAEMGLQQTTQVCRKASVARGNRSTGGPNGPRESELGI